MGAIFESSLQNAPFFRPGYDPEKSRIVIEPVPGLWDGIDKTTIVETPKQMMEVTMRGVPSPRSFPLEEKPGPFRTTSWYPYETRIDGKAFDFRELLLSGLEFCVGDVKRWGLLQFAQNSVVRYRIAGLHGEAMNMMFTSVDLGHYNLYRYGIAICTTSAPCDYCAASMCWYRPRMVVAGTTIPQTIAALNFHEAKSPAEVERLRAEADKYDPETEDWVMMLREDLNITVYPGVMADEIVERLFKTYDGIIYGAGPSDNN